MHREIIPGRKKRVRQCPLYSLYFADSLSSSVKVVSLAGVAEAKRHGWPPTDWCSTQHQLVLSQMVGHV